MNGPKCSSAGPERERPNPVQEALRRPRVSLHAVGLFRLGSGAQAQPFRSAGLPVRCHGASPSSPSLARPVLQQQASQFLQDHLDMVSASSNTPSLQPTGMFWLCVENDVHEILGHSLLFRLPKMSKK